ncbi:protein Wnt-1-like [Physella acuta]|uniref:protein Wnt-1-like n=1 Tax=Physella acuta TaxID=109671 RepID=UPI0027DACBC1|nr:protein Wnt-1-like [Physella acuta]
MKPMPMMCLTVLVAFLSDVTSQATGKIKAPKGTKWWSLAKSGQPSNDLRSPITKHNNNPSLEPLTRRQRKLVTRNPGTIVAVESGAKMAISECKHQFKNRRWNCPTNFDGHTNSIFGKILQKGCRETAFIYAITSAAVCHTVARACAEGHVTTCTCDTDPHGRPSGGDWEWSGCSDNAKFGKNFSRKFVDVLEKGRDFRYMTNLHNNEAGRLHVTSQLRTECKCHGMSGSCTIKTCWRTLPPFREVGNSLKDRFDGASRILPENSGSGRSKKKRKLNFTPANPNLKKPEKTDLVYFEESPSFCEKDQGIGIEGTVGRECNGTSLGVDGCDLMCCGRGYKTEEYLAQERCQCIFIWCCDVKCKVCPVTRTRHTCL